MPSPPPTARFPRLSIATASGGRAFPRIRTWATTEPPTASHTVVVPSSVGWVTTNVPSGLIARRSPSPEEAHCASGPAVTSAAEISRRPESSTIGRSCHTATVGPQPAVTTVVPSAEIATAWAFVWSTSSTWRRDSGSQASSDSPTVAKVQRGSCPHGPLQAMALTGRGTENVGRPVARSQIVRRAPPTAANCPLGSTATIPVASGSTLSAAPPASCTTAEPAAPTTSTRAPSGDDRHLARVAHLVGERRSVAGVEAITYAAPHDELIDRRRDSGRFVARSGADNGGPGGAPGRGAGGAVARVEQDNAVAGRRHRPTEVQVDRAGLVGRPSQHRAAVDVDQLQRRGRSDRCGEAALRVDRDNVGSRPLRRPGIARHHHGADGLTDERRPAVRE